MLLSAVLALLHLKDKWVLEGLSPHAGGCCERCCRDREQPYSRSCAAGLCWCAEDQSRPTAWLNIYLHSTEQGWPELHGRHRTAHRAPSGLLPTLNGHHSPAPCWFSVEAISAETWYFFNIILSNATLSSQHRIFKHVHLRNCISSFQALWRWSVAFLASRRELH